MNHEHLYDPVGDIIADAISRELPVADVGTPGSARFAQAAIARVGQAIVLAVGEVAQALFEAVLP